jgi:alpha-mannosidase
VRTCYVPATRLGEEAELVSVTPPRVRLSALAREGDKVIARVVNLSDTPAQVRIGLPCSVASARLVDLKGDDFPGEVSTCSGQASVTLKPWQVATVEITPA